jgi:DNA polymerase I-like protein with 3'-5' exonuclease and polymerase domains
VTEEQAKEMRKDWLRRYPALQNIPLRTEIGRAVRAAFAPAPAAILDADFAQIERRLVRR